MDIHQKIRKCLKKWMSDMDLYNAMVFYFNYGGSPPTLARERRNVNGLAERYAVNQNNVQFKQFRIGRK